MEMWMFTMWCYERGLAGSPRVPLRFQLALRAPEGRCSDLTRPFFADSHWEAEPYQRLFFCSKVAIEFPQDLGGLRPRHRTTLCSQSVKFRRAPYGPDTQRHSRHRTVLQQPGPRPHIISKLQSQGHVYFSLLQSTTIYRTGTVLTQCYSGSLSSDTSLMGKGWVSNAFGPTNVFPDAW